MSYLDDREREIVKAHERRMASRSRFIEGNPGAVSPQERASVMQWKNDQGLTGRERALQQHEMNMLKQRGAIDLGVAEQKRLGMREQGSAAAEANGRFGLETEKLRGANALTLAEKEWAGKKEIADIGLKQHELEWGNDGGRERIARIEGGSRVDAARAQAEAAAEQQAQKNALEEQKRLAEKERFEKNMKYKYERLDEQKRKNVDDAANKLMEDSNGKISLEEARAQVMAGREQSQQGGNITTDSTGKKWEIVRDANGKPIGKRAVQ